MAARTRLPAGEARPLTRQDEHQGLQRTLMTGVFRLYKLQARPAVSSVTPPPMAITGSFRLNMRLQCQGGPLAWVSRLQITLQPLVRPEKSHSKQNAGECVLYSCPAGGLKVSRALIYLLIENSCMAAARLKTWSKSLFCSSA